MGSDVGNEKYSESERETITGWAMMISGQGVGEVSEPFFQVNHVRGAEGAVAEGITRWTGIAGGVHETHGLRRECRYVSQGDLAHAWRARAADTVEIRLGRGEGTRGEKSLSQRKKREPVG